MITFKEQFDKLTAAYIKGEVHPFQNCACFVGNLLNGQHAWGATRTYSSNGIQARRCEQLPLYFLEYYKEGLNCINTASDRTYTVKDIVRLENNFMRIITRNWSILEPHTPSEDCLFEAFSSTLDLLKEIHESKGEVVDPFEFTKRQLVTA